ncbi:hypothetical protein GCM10027280_26300 [Micromonospora polyrhachis]|uniref:Uncharacterized protein n=1 Tax=Micromonospora polyrhachis TaxID=1282883 RepID=A0A7W7WNN2_9ACTN|nr:hypothetical protein [Micromonospora polyrhachis]
MTGLVLLAGLGTGVGLWLLVVGWFPRPPRLDKTLDAPYRLDRAVDAAEVRSLGWTGRWGRPAVRWLRQAGLPLPSTRRDLATVDKPVDVHLAEQATATVFGLLLPPAAATLLAIAGVGTGVTMPAAASLLLGAAGFLVSELSVRSEAAKHRAAFRDASAPRSPAPPRPWYLACGGLSAPPSYDPSSASCPRFVGSRLLKHWRQSTEGGETYGELSLVLQFPV